MQRIMSITIRPITTAVEAEHFQEIERRVWLAPELDVMPTHVLITVALNGGGVIGAYADDGPPDLNGLVGVALWWLGVGRHPVTGQEQVKACSHMAGVLPAWQGQRVGLRLKLAQREMILTQGVTDWVTWTYDPLYRANGVFNIRRLGATCNTYKRDIYGAMQDALNRGVPSDRCQVDWLLNSPHVLRDMDSHRRRSDWHPDDLHVLPSTARDDGLDAPVDVTPPLDGTPVAVPLPDNIATIRARDAKLSMAWRLYQRTVLEAAFGAGYAMVDCVQLPGRGWHYVLVREYV